ncbi:MAG: DNA gyrase inhibitor YacG [Burkholderiales bacterium]|nr:MAG: DNA gyrase inhibitor YacG [Burkholderiales bacterium]
MTREVSCPTCGRKVQWRPESRFRPFCSERCRLVDLGGWAAERYAIPADAQGEQDPEPPAETAHGSGRTGP